MRTPILLLLLCLTGVIFIAELSWAQDTMQTLPDSVVATAAPVVFRGDTLFWLEAKLGPYSPQERARGIVDRLTRLAKDASYRRDTLNIESVPGQSDILIGDVVVTTVTDRDAAVAGKSRQELTNTRAHLLYAALQKKFEQTSLRAILISIGLTIVATVIFLLAVRLSAKAAAWGIRKVESLPISKLPSIRIHKYELLSAARVASFLVGIVKLIRLVGFLILLYVYATYALGRFPLTAGLSHKLLGYLLLPIRLAGEAFVRYLPNLFFIIVTVVLVRIVMRFTRGFFRAIEQGTVVVPGFYSDWADTTYKIVRFLIIAFALVIVFPYIPGSDSPAFKGLSIFFGVLFSLGSTSAIANVVAGVVLTYMRPFKDGDRVQIADTIGDVMGKGVLVTRVRTIKNEHISIPNALVLGNHIVNFSSATQQQGLIVHTEVTIGYDAPWRTVHELLINAAQATKDILNTPEPFVLQKGLDDFYVRYELNAYTDRPNLMASIYSELHQNIQDRFNEAGVEITSPHYSSLRDGNPIAIPLDYVGKEYVSPSFRVSVTNTASKQPVTQP
ncbi:MAG: mechanosensitive ion channel domain-containing protein [bacterium]